MADYLRGMGSKLQEWLKIALTFQSKTKLLVFLIYLLALVNSGLEPQVTIDYLLKGCFGFWGAMAVVEGCRGLRGIK